MAPPSGTTATTAGPAPAPLSPRDAGETLADGEERRLGEAAVPARPPAGQPRAASADTGPLTRGPAPAEETAPAAQASSPAAPPPEGAPGAQVAQTAAPEKPRPVPDRGPWHAASERGGPSAGPGRLAEGRNSRRGERGGCTRSSDRGPREPRHRPSRPRRGARHAAGAEDGPRAGPERLAGGRRSRSGGQGGRQVPRPRKAQPHPHQPPRAVPPRAAFPTGRPRPICLSAPERTPPGVTLPQLGRQQDARRVIREGGGSTQAGQGTGQGGAERGTGA